jgi:hypothetical protein
MFLIIISKYQECLCMYSLHLVTTISLKPNIFGMKCNYTAIFSIHYSDRMIDIFRLLHDQVVFCAVCELPGGWGLNPRAISRGVQPPLPLPLPSLFMGVRGQSPRKIFFDLHMVVREF